MGPELDCQRPARLRPTWPRSCAGFQKRGSAASFIPLPPEFTALEDEERGCLFAGKLPTGSIGLALCKQSNVKGLPSPSLTYQERSHFPCYLELS